MPRKLRPRSFSHKRMSALNWKENSKRKGDRP
jgi:hypothetical protein